MNSKMALPIIVAFILLSLVFTTGQAVVSTDIEEPPLESVFVDLKQPRKYVVVDENEAMQGIQYPADPGLLSRASGAIFTITYVAAGGTDLWGQTCVTFPNNAKAAFNYAAAIWASTISSSVPITIKACWASLPSPSILGYSGGGTLSRDFAGAPLTNTWYTASLANSLYGSDLDPANEDVHITYNTNFSWYTGLDANPPGGTYDLVTVATHEIGHGLNFAGSAIQSGATGSYGYGTGYPNVYDTFMRNYSGTLLINYTNPSAALGTLLTSGSLWFHGTNAMAANGSSRVKMYAPPTWVTGSSYSHLDYATFAGTINSMMVYAIPSSTANHNTGPITRGLLQDLGWASGPTYNNFLPIILNGGNSSLTDPILNGNFEAGHSSWIEYSANVWPLIVSSAPVTAHGGSWLTWLGGGDNETSRLSQSVLIPPGLSILHYWYWSSSVETVCTYDYFRLKVNGSSQLTTGLCTASNTGAWVERAIDLSAFAGLTVTLMFDVTTDNSKISSFFLDDVSLEATTRISESILIDGINDSSTMRK